jgi:hypothetical protein
VENTIRPTGLAADVTPARDEDPNRPEKKTGTNDNLHDNESMGSTTDAVEGLANKGKAKVATVEEAGEDGT